MEWNQDAVRKIRGLIVFAVAAMVVGSNYRSLLRAVMTFVGMLAPFILGGAIAFGLNVPMRWIEKKLSSRRSFPMRRAVSLVLALAAVLGILAVVMIVVIPEFYRTLIGLQRSIPPFLAGIQRELERIFSDNPDIVSYISSLELDWEGTLQKMMGFISTGAGTILSTTFSAAAVIANGLTNLLIGFIFAIYILLQKETLARQTKKLLQAFLPEKTAERVTEVAALTERIFSSFLTGQCTEAVILGMMFFVTMTVLRMPYALLIGVLIAFTALIPIFGALIGCVVGAFLILIVSPVQALAFVAVFFVLQQIEGNLIYPHVVGGSVGLPPIWVLAAVTIGGSMFGILGMLVFIPLVSVLYALLREAVNGRLERKRKSP